MPRMQVDVAGFAWWRVLAWSGLTAGALLLASLLQAVATVGTAGAVESKPTPIQLSSASAGVTDAHEIRVGDPGVLADLSFLAHPPDANCEMTARQPLYTGQNSWVTQASWQCADPVP